MIVFYLKLINFYCYEFLLKNRENIIINIKRIIFLGFIIICFYNIFHYKDENLNSIKTKYKISKLITENFFIIESNDLENVKSHLYGFIISKKGILTDNYFKQLGFYKEPEPQGVYIMVRNIGKEIILNQDFYGSFGIYLYENKDTGYFALSNSFLLLETYLIGKQNISFNKDFSDNFIISELCTPSIHETLINEIIKLQSNIFIIINIEKKIIKIHYIDYKENTISLDSIEGLKIIDKWVDKWGYILRSIKKKTDNIYSDLSGGFDTRIILSILLNSQIDLNDIYIKSSTDNVHGHDEDYKIAKNISIRYGFKLNNFNLDNNCINWTAKDSISSSLYTKLGIHKEFYLKNCFYKSPRFGFTGAGGEIIRGSPGYPINKYKKKISSAYKIKGHEQELFESSMRICNRSVILLKKKKKYNNDYEISSDLYTQGRARNHFGKLALEGFLANIYSLQPLMDPEIKTIRYNINSNLPHDLIAYIYIRFSNDLIKFPFQGERTLNPKSVKKAQILNERILPYKKKTDYNKDFYIDNNRISPVHNSKNYANANNLFKKVFNSSKFTQLIRQIYDKNIYNWAKGYSEISNYYPLRHGYGLLAIAITKEFLVLNKKYWKKSIKPNNLKKEKTILNYLTN